MLQRESNPLTYLFGMAWRYSFGDRKKVVLFWLMFAVSTSVHLFGQPLLWAEVMNVIQARGINQESFGTLLTLLALSVGIEIVFWLLHGPARFLEETNAFRTRAKYRKHLLQGVLTLPLEWHTDHHSGDTIDKIEKGTSGLYRFSQQTFQIIYGVVHLFGSYAILTYFSPPAGLIVGVMIVVAGWITVHFDKILVAQYICINRSENEVSESVFDAISNISTIIILRVERLLFSSIVRKIDAPYELVRKNTIANEWKWYLTNMSCALMTVIVLGVYFFQHLGTEKGVLVGSVYLLIQYLNRVSEQFYQFTMMYGDMLQRKSRVMNAEELAKDFRKESLSNHVLPSTWQRIAISDLRFSYDTERGTHLTDVSLSIRRGGKIAFVGETGSGKTTLLKVMRDLYHPQNLSLSVDGSQVPHGFNGISRAIALIPQNPEIFATTIFENITLGTEHDEAFVRHFTDMACFTEVADSLPHGFNSSIKEKGVDLSGGQQQRLALSRGLLACHDKDIVLLDEPTSSLDTATEMQVYKNIFREFDGKVIISSIHRLHLLPLFDRICVFDKGAIVASGTLGELLASCPQFITLWKTVEEAKHPELGSVC